MIFDGNIVGLTGGIGAGKSAVAARFAEHGVAVVDTDAIAYQLTTAGGRAIPAITTVFGREVLTSTGALNRKIMRERVFMDQSQRLCLQQILHPMICAESLARLRKARGLYAILVVPLLFEYPHYQQWLSRFLVVDCDESKQISRAMQRPHMTEEMVRAIIATQMPRQQRRALADDVIDNNGALDDLRLQVDEKHRYYSEKLSKTLTES